jgi:hypothetical protein
LFDLVNVELNVGEGFGLPVLPFGAFFVCGHLEFMHGRNPLGCAP